MTCAENDRKKLSSKGFVIMFYKIGDWAYYTLENIGCYIRGRPQSIFSSGML